jgi:type I restriction-modification system DNA methylase subunit
MTSQTAPAIIHKLVETFEQNLDSYRSSKNETELRRQFLDPFFTALGWDVANEKGYDEAGKEVTHEFSVDVAGQQKKADYAFRVGRGEKFDFLVEAKKPSVKVETSQEAAFQIRRYGWSAKLPINILSDFEHFAVYDCRTKPSYNDKASMGRIMLIHYKDYVSRWNEIVEIFSPEAVRKGSFAKYAEGMKGKKGTADVDDAFLQEIERWRELLAKNIALRNEEIDIAGLNYSVQMTIDRIVFLRICEERGIEPENQLLGIANNENSYEELCELFKRADTKYNSGLFHFKNEKELFSRPDDLTLTLNLDDKVLKDIISNLYYPKSPYAFLYIPSDILGQVYERFLGKVIRLTAGHNAKVEEKPEVRKAGGVYYTPTYIVEYIVKNTVGKLIENKSPKDVASFKIVDPACGSGTFLLGAYQFLLDWHLNWYTDVKNEPEKWASGKSPAIYKPVTYYKQAEVTEDMDGKRVIREGVAEVKGEWKLTTAKKRKILLNNIYGVDIDPQAVEVTKLSLLLKVLENGNGQLGLGMERILPDLGNNIKCGNSLIGFDYFECQLLPEESERAKVNPFNWQNGFKEIFLNGGFDVVIGNPPWGAEFTQKEKEYLKISYDGFHVRTPESFNYFVGKMWKLAENKGLAGLIIPSSFLNQHEFWKTRKILVENSVFSRICNLGDGVFAGVTAPSCILVFGKEIKPETNSLFFDFRKNNKTDLPRLLVQEENGHSAIAIGQSSEDYVLQIRSDGNIIQKCYEHPPLRDIAEDVATGVSSGLDAAFIYTKSNADKLKLEKFILRKLIIGGEINRYSLTPESQKLIIYATKEIDIKDFPHCHAALEKYRDRLKERVETKSGVIPWYSLYRPRRKKLFELPKILVRQTADKIMACIDYDNWYCLKSGIIIQLPDNAETSYNYLLGLLNSRLTKFLYDDLVGEQARVFPEVKPVQLFKLPIRPINFADTAEKSQHDKMVILVEQMLELHKRLVKAKTPQEKEGLERQIQETDSLIDSLVYELYGLNEEEIKIVQGSL